MLIKSIIKNCLLLSLALASSSLFGERFLNVSKKKVKISVIDLNQDSEIKSFVLAPMSHKIIDLTQFKGSGIGIVLKPMRSSYLLERRHDKSDKCEQCGQIVEARCGCPKSSRKEKKDQTLEMEIDPREMNVQNEFIILDSQDGLQIKLFGVKSNGHLGAEKD